MNGAAFLLAVGLAACAGAAHAEQFKPVFNMESGTLQPLPPGALAAVRTHVERISDAQCAAGGFVGEPVDLTGGRSAQDWVAITADGCAWGSSSAVIWVIRQERGAYRVVLQTGGHSVGLARKRSGILLDLKTYHGTAGYYNETRYKYNGRKYVVFQSRHVDLGNPEDCKRNRDLDVCKPVQSTVQ